MSDEVQVPFTVEELWMCHEALKDPKIIGRDDLRTDIVYKVGSALTRCKEKQLVRTFIGLEEEDCRYMVSFCSYKAISPRNEAIGKKVMLRLFSAWRVIRGEAEQVIMEDVDTKDWAYQRHHIENWFHRDELARVLAAEEEKYGTGEAVSRDSGDEGAGTVLRSDSPGAGDTGGVSEESDVSGEEATSGGDKGGEPTLPIDGDPDLTRNDEDIDEFRRLFGEWP